MCSSDPEDEILHELIAMDYFLQYNIRPADIFSISLSKDISNQIIEQHQLNHHKYRFVMLPVSFCWETWINENKIIEKKSIVILQYDGKRKPKTVVGLSGITTPR